MRQRTGCVKAGPPGPPDLLQKIPPDRPFKPEPRLAWQVELLRGPGAGLNINEQPRASRPSLPGRACRAWASSLGPVGLHQTPACQTKLVDQSLLAPPSPRSPP